MSTSTSSQAGFRQSISRWCANNFTLDELCREGKALGLEGIDLVNPEDFPTLKAHGLVASLVFSPRVKVGDKEIGTIPHSFNRLEYHDVLVESLTDLIPVVANAGYSQIVCFSGNRDGMDDEEGLENCATGLKRILPLAEKHKIILTMEGLNGVSHVDYMYDTTAWGVELSCRLASPSFKLLYDIFHMQVMEGNIIDTIREFHPHFSHYHTAGVPGRGPLDDNQEINYPPIMRAIRDTGYTGFVAHEFSLGKERQIEKLRQAIEVCTI